MAHVLEPLITLLVNKRLDEADRLIKDFVIATARNAHLSLMEEMESDDAAMDEPGEDEDAFEKPEDDAPPAEEVGDGDGDELATPDALEDAMSRLVADLKDMVGDADDAGDEPMDAGLDDGAVDMDAPPVDEDENEGMPPEMGMGDAPSMDGGDEMPPMGDGDGDEPADGDYITVDDLDAAIQEVEGEIADILADAGVTSGDDEHMEPDADVSDEVDPSGAPDEGSSLDSDDDFEKLINEFEKLDESILDELEKVNVKLTDGETIGTGNSFKPKGDVKSNIDGSRKANGGDAKPFVLKSTNHSGYDREASPNVNKPAMPTTQLTGKAASVTAVKQPANKDGEGVGTGSSFKPTGSTNSPIGDRGGLTNAGQKTFESRGRKPVAKPAAAKVTEKKSGKK